MKPITWIQLFILCAGIGQAWAVKAQDVRFLSQEKIDSLINPPLMKQGDEILRKHSINSPFHSKNVILLL